MVVLLYSVVREREGRLRNAVPGDRFAPQGRAPSDNFLRLTAVSTSASPQDQSGNPAPHSEEAHRLNSVSARQQDACL